MSRQYSRRVVTLNQDRLGYGVKGKNPFGRCVLEIKENILKISLYVQNLKSGNYNFFIISVKEGKSVGILLSPVKVKDDGKFEIKIENDPDNIEKSYIPIENFNAIAIVESDTKELLSPLVGYTLEIVRWKNNFEIHHKNVVNPPKKSTFVENNNHSKSISSKKSISNLHMGESIVDVSSEETKVSLDVSDVLSEKTEISLDVSDVLSEETKISLDVSDVLSEKTEISLDVSDVLSEKTEISLDVSDVLSEETEISLDVSDVLSEKTEISLDVSDVLSEETKISLDVSDVLSEETEISLDVSDVYSELKSTPYLEPIYTPINIASYNEEANPIEPSTSSDALNYEKLRSEEIRSTVVITDEEFLALQSKSLKIDIHFTMQNNVKMQPFKKQNKDVSWVRISLDELIHLPVDIWEFINSPFIVSAYKKYKHLILGEVKDSPKEYYLGVPEQYLDEDKTVAIELGFFQFKCCDDSKEKVGMHGYWLKKF
jgi:hypothetical protein